MARAAKKKGANPVLKTVEGQVLAPRKGDGTMPDHVLYTESIGKLRGVGGRPSHWENKEELIEQITLYLQSLVNDEGLYVGAPSLNGLGVWLGYASSNWYTTAPHQHIIGHIKLFIKAWRENKIILPRGGINPAAIMFLMNRDDTKELNENTINSVVQQVEDDRPPEAAALIDDVWRMVDDE